MDEKDSDSDRFDSDSDLTQNLIRSEIIRIGLGLNEYFGHIWVQIGSDESRFG